MSSTLIIYTRIITPILERYFGAGLGFTTNRIWALWQIKIVYKIPYLLYKNLEPQVFNNGRNSKV